MLSGPGWQDVPKANQTALKEQTPGDKINLKQRPTGGTGKSRHEWGSPGSEFIRVRSLERA